MAGKAPEAFRTISEVAEILDTPQHVLRFWESKFTKLRPVKRAGGRRYYRPADLALLAGIRQLLHVDGMTIRGVQKLLREKGVRHVALLASPAEAEMAAPGALLEVVAQEAEASESPASAADDAGPDAPQPDLFAGGDPDGAAQLLTEPVEGASLPPGTEADADSQTEIAGPPPPPIGEPAPQAADDSSEPATALQDATEDRTGSTAADHAPASGDAADGVGKAAPDEATHDAPKAETEDSAEDVTAAAPEPVAEADEVAAEHPEAEATPGPRLATILRGLDALPATGDAAADTAAARARLRALAGRSRGLYERMRNAEEAAFRAASGVSVRPGAASRGEA